MAEGEKRKKEEGTEEKGREDDQGNTSKKTVPESEQTKSTSNTCSGALSGLVAYSSDSSGSED